LVSVRRRKSRRRRRRSARLRRGKERVKIAAVKARRVRRKSKPVEDAALAVLENVRSRRSTTRTMVSSKEGREEKEGR